MLLAVVMLAALLERWCNNSLTFLIVVGVKKKIKDLCVLGVVDVTVCCLLCFLA